MSHPVPGPDASSHELAGGVPSQADGTDLAAPGQSPAGDMPAASGEQMHTLVLPPNAVPSGSEPAGATSHRASRLTVGLTVVIGVLLAAVGVLAVLLVNERSAASEVAVAEAAEDSQHEKRMADFESERAELDRQYAAADRAAAAAAQRVEDAEGAQRAAEEQAAAREQAAAEADAADGQTFVDALRAADVMPGTTDAELLTRGRDVCSYLDSTSGSRADLEGAFDRAAESYALEDAILLVTAATHILCPEYGG